MLSDSHNSQIQLFLDLQNFPRLSIYKFALISNRKCSLYHLKQPKDTPTFPFCNITSSASLTPRCRRQSQICNDTRETISQLQIHLQKKIPFKSMQLQEAHQGCYIAEKKYHSFQTCNAFQELCSQIPWILCM